MHTGYNTYATQTRHKTIVPINACVINKNHNPRLFCTTATKQTHTNKRRAAAADAAALLSLSHILRQFIKKFRQKENKNGSLSYFYKDRTPYSADPQIIQDVL